MTGVRAALAATLVVGLGLAWLAVADPKGPAWEVVAPARVELVPGTPGELVLVPVRYVYPYVLTKNTYARVYLFSRVIRARDLPLGLNRWAQRLLEAHKMRADFHPHCSGR